MSKFKLLLKSKGSHHSPCSPCLCFHFFFSLTCVLSLSNRLPLCSCIHLWLSIFFLYQGMLFLIIPHFCFPLAALKKKVHGQKSTNWQRGVAGNKEGKWAIKIPGQVKYGRNSSQTLNGIGSTPKLSCLVPK